MCHSNQPQHLKLRMMMSSWFDDDVAGHQTLEVLFHFVKVQVTKEHFK